MYLRQGLDLVPPVFGDGKGNPGAQLGQAGGVGVQLVGGDQRAPLLKPGMDLGAGQWGLVWRYLSSFLDLEERAVQVDGVGELRALLRPLLQCLGDLLVVNHCPLSSLRGFAVKKKGGPRRTASPLLNITALLGRAAVRLLAEHGEVERHQVEDEGEAGPEPDRVAELQHVREVGGGVGPGPRYDAHIDAVQH